MLFLIHVTQIPVKIMEHVRYCRVMLLVCVHQSIQDRHVKVIYTMAMKRGRLGRSREVCVLIMIVVLPSLSLRRSVCLGRAYRGTDLLTAKSAHRDSVIGNIGRYRISGNNSRG